MMLRRWTWLGLALVVGCEPFDVVLRGNGVKIAPPDAPGLSDGLVGDSVVPEKVRTCADGEETWQSDTWTVTFPTTTDRCPWAIEENLDPQQGLATARVEQWVDLPVGDDIEVCDFEWSLTGWEDDGRLYDDHFLLAFAGVVVASSQADLVATLPTVNGFPQYDWMSMVGTPIDPTTISTWCAGDASGEACVLPSGTRGASFDVPLSDNLRAELVRFLQEDVSLGLVVVGDNDPDSDCAHMELSVELAVHFVQQ